MTEKPSPEEVVRWQHRLAGQANNRAWSPGSARTDECVYECRLAVRSTALSSRGSFNSGSTNDLKAIHGDL
jgi:hypothetical protein